MAIAAAAARPAEAGRFAGADPFDFLFLDGGARQAALGGAFAAGRDDADILRYNPAGLGFMSKSRLAYSSNAHFLDLSQKRLALALKGGLGLSYDQVDYGKIRNTTLANPSGNGLSEFTAVSRALAVGLGLPLSEGLTAGAGLRRIEEKIDDVSAGAWALDIGAQALALDEPPVFLGATVQNIGTKARFVSKREPLPLALRAGAAARLAAFDQPFALILDLNHLPRQEIFVHLGAETTIHEILAVRTGYTTRNDAGPGLTFGFGLKWTRFNFDFAMVPYGELGSSLRLSFGVEWGD